MPVRFTAPWYRRQDYERVRLMMSDRDNFPEGFDEWLHLADEQFAQALAQGMAVEKAIVDPDRFASWCRLRKIEPNAQARVQYAAALLDQERPGHG